MKKIIYIISIIVGLSVLAFAINFFVQQDAVEQENNAPFEEIEENPPAQTPDKIQGYKLTNVEALSSENSKKNFDVPLWSPNGNKILVTTAGGIGLYVIDINTKETQALNEFPLAGYGAAWSLDGQKVFYRKKIGPYNSDLTVESIEISSNELTQHEDINPNGLQSYVLATQGSDPIVYINTQTLALEAMTKDRSKTWTIASDGQYYHPVVSPDQMKVVVHEGNEILVYAFDGSGLITSLGTGIATSWSKDSKQVLAFLDESEDGHQLTGSELYLLNADGSQKWRLTNTPDIYEMWPSWSPDNSRVAFADNKSGRIYTAKIVRE